MLARDEAPGREDVVLLTGGLPLPPENVRMSRSPMALGATYFWMAVGCACAAATAPGRISGGLVYVASSGMNRFPSDDNRRRACDTAQLEPCCCASCITRSRLRAA